jgi:hypothetical protein
MVNPGERSIKVVKRHKPKMLTGLTQNGPVVGTRARYSPVMDTQHYRRTESTYPIRVNLANRGQPVSFLAKRREDRRKAKH